MLCRIYTLWLIALCISLPAFAAGAPLMTVPGQLQVSSTGAATYSIPIVVPPGTSNMAPVLSLDYSSQGADGFEGVGWGLSGLPSISRCPRTVAQDGVHGGVNYDANDKFCMDGQRLILIGGTYGANGSEYRTEIESFSKIVAHGTVGSGPSWFEIHTKTGQILEFGNTADSQALTIGLATNVVRVWAVNKIYDSVGNFLTVTYNSASGSDRTTFGEIYPLTVAYTGHTLPALAPYNTVQFTYSARSDTAPTYQAGALVQTAVLLTHIKTYQAANLVSDYALGFRTGTATLHSRLTSVTQCDGSGNCLPSTTFGWQGGTGQLGLSGAVNTIGQNKMLAPGDFDGDGLTDVAVVDPNSCANFPIYLAQDLYNPSAQSIPNPGVGAISCYTDPRSAQTLLTPSGVSDFLYNTQVTTAGPAVTDYVTLYQTFPNSNPLTVASSMTGAAPPAFAADFNGDGIPDYMLQENPNSPIYVGNSSGSFSFLQNQTGLDPASVSVITADFDGDGCTDILSITATNSTAYFCNPATASAPAPNTAGFTVTVGDFNGDGKADLLLTSPSANGQLWLSTGTGFVEVNAALPNNWGSYSIVVGDWNGDGKADIMLIASGASGYYGAGTSHKLFLSTGTGFVAATDRNGNPVEIPNGATTASAVVADWNNDGGTDFWLQQSGGGAQDTLYSVSYAPELMVSVSNGVGATNWVSYDRLNKNASFYTKGAAAVYPNENMDGPFYVVREIDAGNGLGICAPPNFTYCKITTYTYAGAQMNVSGRGFLGFAQVSSNDQQTNMETVTTYGTAFPYIGLVTSQVKSHAGYALSSITNTYVDNAGCTSTLLTGVYIVCLQRSVATSNDLNGAPFPTVTTDYTYDGYGNALTVAASVSDGSSRTATNTYNNDATNWFIGQLLTTSTRSIVGSSDLTRASSYAYDATTGLLTQDVLEPGVSTCNAGSSSCTVTTSYTHDAFGHRITATVSGTGVTTRTTYAIYDSIGQFQTASVNALGQYSFWTYDPRFGTPATQTDSNYLVTYFTYDGFGRLTFQRNPDNTGIAYNYSYCSGGCMALGAFTVRNTITAADGYTQTGPSGTSIYDALSRVIEANSQGFDGSIISVDTQYDAIGRAARTSRPYFVSAPQCSGAPCWTNFVYDDLGRVTQATAPDSSRINYGFSGLTTTVTNNLSQTRTLVKNAQGLSASVTDPTAHTTSYLYDAFGDPVTITDAVGNVIANSFDIRGHKTASTDPDLGAWSYSYDVLGELNSQTDAKSQTTNLSYDLAGHMLTRDEPGLYSSWTYGNALGDTNIGRLIDAKACTNSGCSSVVSDRMFYYDRMGRYSRTVLTTGGNQYGYGLMYDDLTGKIAHVAYPSEFLLNYAYNSLGYLCRMTEGYGHPTCGDANLTHPLFVVNARDADLQMLQSTAGNGVVTNQTFDPKTGLPQTLRAGAGGAVGSFDYAFDTLGNLTSRTDHDEAFSESFCYDALNRVTNYALGASCTGAGTSTVAYDAIGNITAKSDVGAYAYPATGSARPHAVSSITGTVNGILNPLYGYDANGNLTCTSTGPGCTGTVGQAVAVTSFNMTASLTQGATSLAYTYDTDHSRVTQASTTAGVTTTTTYLNDAASGVISEMVKVGSGSPSWTDYLTVDGHIVAQRTSVPDPAHSWGSANWNGFEWGYEVAGSRWGQVNWGSFPWADARAPETWAYFTLDHLGSVAVIADASGAVTQRLSYDAWGKPRNPNGTAAACGAISSSTTRGYTNQEQIAAACLVNLNARLYDPTLGKMLSADSVVPDASDGQAFNRYAYVTNNPLSFTDPTGHDFSDWLESVWHGLSSEFDNFFIYNDNLQAQYASQPADSGIESVTVYGGGGSYTLYASDAHDAGSNDVAGTGGGADPAQGITASNLSNADPVIAPPSKAASAPATTSPPKAAPTSVNLGSQPVSRTNSSGTPTTSNTLAGNSTRNLSGMGASGTNRTPDGGVQAWPSDAAVAGFLGVAATVLPVGKVVEGAGWLGRTLGIISDEAAVADSVTFGAKIEAQMGGRGWSATTVNEAIENPSATSAAVNRATGNPATAYFNSDGSYVVRDNVTGDVVQISNRNDPNWIPDSSIKNPPK